MCEVNNRYGYYTVIEEPYKKEFDRKGKTRFRIYAKAKCDCGTIKNVRLDGLKSGHVVSCGCYNRRISSEQKTRLTHGLRYHPLNKVWRSMKDRCANSKCPHFKNYGGRGISVCEVWKNNFKIFYDWAVSNGYEHGLEIDRINVNGNYEPSNCRWVTSEINANNKRNNTKYEYNGELLTLPQIARKHGIGFPTLYRRIHENNLPLSEALSIPLHGKCKKGPNPQRKFSYETAIEIYNSKERTPVLCEKYNVHKSTIDGIRSGTRYSDYTQSIKTAS